MTIALHVTLELEKFDTEYRNLDNYVMDIVNNNLEENQFEITVDNKLVRHEIDIDETAYYIKDDNFILNTIIMINEHIDNLDMFVSKMKINDFMINSYMENQMFDVKIKNIHVNDYCELELETV